MIDTSPALVCVNSCKLPLCKQFELPLRRYLRDCYSVPFTTKGPFADVLRQQTTWRCPVCEHHLEHRQDALGKRALGTWEAAETIVEAWEFRGRVAAFLTSVTHSFFALRCIITAFKKASRSHDEDLPFGTSEEQPPHPRPCACHTKRTSASSKSFVSSKVCTARRRECG